MTTRITRRGAVHSDTVIENDIIEKKLSRTRKRKDNENLPMESDEFGEKRARQTLSIKNESVDLYINHSNIQRNTRSRKDFIKIDEIEPKLNLKQRKNKFNKVNALTENSTAMAEPVSRRTLRKDKEIMYTTSNAGIFSSDSSKESDKENINEGSTKTRNNTTKNSKSRCVPLTAKSNSDIDQEESSVPSKRGSTDGLMVAKNKTRKGKKSNQKLLPNITDDNHKKSKIPKRSSNVITETEMVNTKNDIILDKRISRASHETTYHSINESTNVMTISKDDASFSSVKESNDKNAKYSISDVTKATKNKKAKKNSKKNKKNEIEKEVIDCHHSKVIEESPLIITVDDSIDSLKDRAVNRESLFMIGSKNNVRISGIEELPLPIARSSRNSTLIRERTYIKDDTNLDTDTSTNRTFDISHNRSDSKKHTFSAASPCKLFPRIGSIKSNINNTLKTPVKMVCRAISVGSAGRTPMPPPKKSQCDETNVESKDTPIKKPLLNITHSIEKPTLARSLSEDVDKPKNKVAFHSPNKKQQAVNTSNNHKMIKSNLKGSTKSFIMENIASATKPNSRKRSLTQNDHTEGREVKIRKMTNNKSNISAKNTLSKLKTPISAGKHLYNSRLNATISSAVTPAKSIIKPQAPVSRSKMPNFASLHKKQFDQMESLVDNKARREERARQLLFPTTLPNGLKTSNDTKPTAVVQPEPIFTRFGFKLNSGDVQRFGAETLSKSSPLPVVKLNRKLEARRAVMQEEKVSLVEKRRAENRNFVKGVRTNRRFELQMKARNLAA